MTLAAVCPTDLAPGAASHSQDNHDETLKEDSTNSCLSIPPASEMNKSWSLRLSSFGSSDGSSFGKNLSSFGRRTKKRALRTMSVLAEALPHARHKQLSKPARAPPGSHDEGLRAYAARGLYVPLAALVDALHHTILAYSPMDFEYEASTYCFLVRLQSMGMTCQPASSDLSAMGSKVGGKQLVASPIGATALPTNMRTAGVAISLYSNDAGGFDISMRRLCAPSLAFHNFFHHVRASLADHFGVDRQTVMLSPSHSLRQLATQSIDQVQRTCPPSRRTLHLGETGTGPHKPSIMTRFSHAFIRKRAHPSVLSASLPSSSMVSLRLHKPTPAAAPASVISAALPTPPIPANPLDIPLAPGFSELIDEAVRTYTIPLAPLPKELDGEDA